MIFKQTEWLSFTLQIVCVRPWLRETVSSRISSLRRLCLFSNSAIQSCNVIRLSVSSYLHIRNASGRGSASGKGLRSGGSAPGGCLHPRGVGVGQTPPQLEKRAVRILLECFLVRHLQYLSNIDLS